MIKKIIHSIFILFIFLLVSCGNKAIRGVEDYLSFMNKEENGLSIKKQVNGFEIKLTYLTADYLTFRELSAEYTLNPDSLKNFYSQSLTFMMTITPNEEKRKGEDVVLHGIKNYAAYKERLYNLNFEIENNISVETGSLRLKPVLTSFENSYGLTSGRSFLFVFAPAENGQDEFYNSQTVDFIYEDELFDTGINHFSFSRRDLMNAPALLLAENIQ